MTENETFSTSPTTEELKDQAIFSEIKKLANRDNSAGTFRELNKLLHETNTTYNLKQIRRMADELEQFTEFRTLTYSLDRNSVLGGVFNSDNRIIRDGLITVGGEASSGKSSFVTQLSTDILKANQDFCFLFYSLDDSRALSGRRIITQLTSASFTDRISELSDDVLDVLRRITILDDINLSEITTDIETTKKISETNKIIIVIDYLQIVPSQGGQRRDELNEFAKQLKEVQKTFAFDGCIMFLLSQFNRSSDSGAVYRYRETSEIENQSDACIDILRDSKNSDELTNERIIRISKNKIGKRGEKWKTKINESFLFEIVRTETKNHQDDLKRRT